MTQPQSVATTSYTSNGQIVSDISRNKKKRSQMRMVTVLQSV